MSALVVPQIASGLSNEELADIVARLSKEVDWFANGNISSQNVRNIAGYNVSETELRHKSGIVGMSGFDAANPLAVRFWSGDADKYNAPFRVLQSGALFATDAFITGRIEGSVIIGSEIKTAESTYPRVEMSATDNLFAAYATANESIKISPVYVGSPSIHFVDGGVVKANMAVPSGGGLGIITSGTSDINLQSAADVNLDPSSNLQIGGVNGYSGAFDVVTAVDFGSSSVTKRTITVTKGIITSA